MSARTDSEAMAARRAGLRYVRSQRHGITRLSARGGFVYRDARGRRVRDERTLLRIRKLAVPPAYQDVWICADPDGHLQATGRDARRRKQYRYHPKWQEVRARSKFGRMIEFGEALPALRRKLSRDLARRGLPREKVLAAVVRLLDTTRLRIGNAEYARDNNSFGLTTLRDRHVEFTGNGHARLSFRGKSGIEHDVLIDDRRLSRIVRDCRALPGQHLFQYLDDEGARVEVDAAQVNDYLREKMGESFTAKDFRTWGATLRAIALMACTPLPDSQRRRNGCILKAVRTVAEELRNTPTVCRKSYINPLVFTGWSEGRLHRITGARKGRTAEKDALRFLKLVSKS